MNSSISNSNPRHTIDVRCVQAFIAATVACFILAAAAYHLPSFKSLRPPAARASVPADAKDYYVGYAHGGADEYDIYFNVNGAANALKKANVLFLGGSRTKYAFRDSALLHRFFDKRHLKYFVLGFGYGEPSVFPLAIIRKYDLHPKWVIVNADPFFTGGSSPFASGVLKASRFDAQKFSFETTTAFRFEHAIHTVLPYMDITQWCGEADGVEFRSKLDGTIIPSGTEGNPSDVVVDDVKTVPRADPFFVQIAKEFQNEMAARGAKMIITWIPTGPLATRPLVRLANVPLIVTRLTGLRTIDGSHLDARSAHRFCAAFLAKLDSMIGVSRANGRITAASPAKT